MQRRWIVVASFFTGQDDRWLDDFIRDERIMFSKEAPRNPEGSWHSGTMRKTPVSRWLAHLRHARSAFAKRPDGLICCFPQLTMCSALLKKLGRHNPSIIAYNYNLGGFPSGIRQRLARWVAQEVDIFVVHSPREVSSYAEYLGVPKERVRFIPLQQGKIDVPREEDQENPFLLAMGSADRDYATLIKAVDALGIQTTIVTRAADIESLPKSPHVTFLSDLSLQACRELLARARVSVTPVSNLETASGQITFVSAMQLGVPVIATRCPGTDGYIENGKTGLLVSPFDVAEMREKIDLLWHESDMRRTLSGAAKREATERFSDEAAAARLLELIID